MCRNRSHRCRRRNDNVAGDFGIQRIALRGPGCIDGTGRCQGVLGTGGRCRCNDGVLGTGGDRCDEVLGTGGRRRCEDVLGTGGRRRCEDVLGTGGRRRCDDVLGTGGRRHHCCKHDNWLWNDLETPTTVPR
ncbi:hypothetical protein [Sedimentibacter saalensis]|uniref:hypothetical protein n=1 Tax=Sedimentibacter saalensis TaxID=130788 RepID=UPI002898CC83|nr:hypothetical protein [Sedimentibacter saalensis]